MRSPSNLQSRSLRVALESDLEQIEDNVGLYYSGRRSAYQTVAIQLRELTLGRKNLIERVIPDATFHELVQPHPEIARPTSPGFDRIVFFGGRGPLKLGGPEGARMALQWQDPPSLPLTQWRAQWVIVPWVTVGKLILDVANEEVAHTDESIGTTIGAANVLRFGGTSVSGIEMHQLTVVALGEYIAGRMRTLLSA